MNVHCVSHKIENCNGFLNKLKDRNNGIFVHKLLAELIPEPNLKKQKNRIIRFQMQKLKTTLLLL